MAEATRTVAVIGATGTQGGSVARSLLQNTDFQVLCITRDISTSKAKELKALGAKITQADTTSHKDLEVTLSGCWGVYINYTVFGMEPEVSENLGKTILSSAAAANVKHVVFSSDPNTDQLTGGRVTLSAMSVKARAEKWALDNLHFETFTPISAGWYLENFMSPELEEFHGGFPTKKDDDGYLTLRLPYWGGKEQVPWISMKDDYGDLVHGIFLNPLRWNLRLVQAVADPMPFEDLVRIFSQVTEKKARFTAFQSPAEMGGDLMEGPASMFVYTQLRDGEYYGNGPTENHSAAQLKNSVYQSKGGKGRQTLMTVREWFEREFPIGA
ncbi:NmrA-like family domain-containing oxidoreductase himF [Penicillium nucicola]|uniref:NmrA-like family domain-containing oxidoreductase himF n=1 Tax=Penicillium nucicola TaxID=1850975 RepID=UPI0025458D67|nr:NmrA-like family domain-containing oxidoreductase himF [Penicillium nucicola]KAJ5766287.1 NmrA-like family domain-containing oxidoreductase himF [Penicillium nucicola]